MRASGTLVLDPADIVEAVQEWLCKRWPNNPPVVTNYQLDPMSIVVQPNQGYPPMPLYNPRLQINLVGNYQFVTGKPEPSSP